ncbi:hypothetical protein OS493_003096 [Desmophyllum pertusum]|uniref:Uncharacterized protein n=1 Tax=Desmophyllum pertusum TaxID=174260 RepID=A0A9W9YJX5_9CNID|nr:hypothetical protein OS493_003096 [Desmophyllum pertusum]
MVKFERIRNIRQRKQKLKSEYGLAECREFFTAALSVITVGCIPKQRRFDVSFNFEDRGKEFFSLDF